MDIPDFVARRYSPRKVASEITSFSWVYPNIPSHTQTYLGLPRVLLGSLGGIARLKIIQNERIISK